MVFEILVIILVGALGFLSGTMVSLKNKGSPSDNETINQRVLEERLGKVEERIQVLEDYVQSSIRDGGEMKQQPRSNDNVDWELVDLRIITLYRNGYSIRGIARELGLSKSSVHRRLRKILGAAKS